MDDTPAGTCPLCGDPVHGATTHPCCDWWIRDQGHDCCYACAETHRTGGVLGPIPLPRNRPERVGDAQERTEPVARPEPAEDLEPFDPAAAHQRGVAAATELRRVAIDELSDLLEHGELTGLERGRLTWQLERLRQHERQDTHPTPADDTEATMTDTTQTERTARSVFVSRQQMLDAALQYADLGLRVIPIRVGRKYPPMDSWQNLATSDPTIIRSWWNGPYRRCGVGIATGIGSLIWALDVDVANGKSGAASLADLEASYGPLPDTLEAITGTGGRHLYFAWEPAHPVHNDQSGRAGPGLDVRGEGGQVLAAPTTHPTTGQPYRWRVGHGPGEIPVARAPGWLTALLEREPDPPTPTAVRGPRSSVTLTGLHDDSPAAAFNDSTTWDQLLTRDGWTLTRTLPNGEQRWTRPGKTPRDGISATVGHAGRDVLKVFTSSIPGLEADGAYSRFGYEAALHHHGDRSGFAAELRRQMNRDRLAEAAGRIEGRGGLGAPVTAAERPGSTVHHRCP
jgi:hypothetical protein